MPPTWWTPAENKFCSHMFVLYTGASIALELKTQGLMKNSKDKVALKLRINKIYIVLFSFDHGGEKLGYN